MTCPHQHICSDDDTGSLECVVCGVVVGYGYNPEVDRVGIHMDCAVAAAVRIFTDTGRPATAEEVRAAMEGPGHDGHVELAQVMERDPDA